MKRAIFSGVAIITLTGAALAQMRVHRAPGRRAELAVVVSVNLSFEFARHELLRRHTYRVTEVTRPHHY